MTDARPLTIGPKNAEAMTGLSWRWLRDHAAELGVEIISVDGKRFILAAPLLAALERRTTTSSAAKLDDIDELAAMRARLGKQRRTAAG